MKTKTLPKLQGLTIRVADSYKGLSLGEPSKIAGQTFQVKAVEWANCDDTKPCIKIEHEKIHGYTTTWLGMNDFTVED